MLQGKRILLGVSGSIAAYKSANLVRLLVKQGADVKVILTQAAQDFITPVTLSTVSKNPVITGFYSNKEQGMWENHVDLGLWADLFLIAPASANTMAKMVHGEADNILLTTYLSARCKTMVFPAMDLDMYVHTSTRTNIDALQKRGDIVFESAAGELASGLVGKGRMQEPEKIVEHVEKYFETSNQLLGNKVLITAGPTHEKIDPVRFIGNNSSGKMGFAIAEELASRGASVVLIAGPTTLKIKSNKIERVDVESAQEMYNAVHQHFESCKVGIFAAAVADYRPKVVTDQKIKKKDTTLQIELEPTPDILASVGKKKRTNQTLVGFALETNNEIENAKSKLERKNLDFIILNSLQDKGAGFAHDTNKISIIDKNNKQTNFELKSKDLVACDIINYLVNFTQE